MFRIFLIYPIVSITAPSMTESPGLTRMDVTVPADSASMLFCIFMASRTMTTSPTATVSPTFTLTALMVPGSGALTGVPAPAVAAGLAAVCGWGAADGTGVTGAAGATGAVADFLVAARGWVLGSIDGFLHLDFKWDAIDVDFGDFSFYFSNLYLVVYTLYFILIFFHCYMLFLMNRG